MKKSFTKKLGLALIPPTVYWILNIIAATMRIKTVNYDVCRALADKNENCIFSCWHGRLGMMPFTYKNRKLTGLISRHSDGELLARFFKKFNIEAVRGSTTRGATEGLRAMIRAARSGRDLGITPDGPKGPPRLAQMGVIQAARLTGLPIIPVTFAASSKATFSSWDSFIFPYPFARGIFIYGDAITVKRDATPEEMEAKRLEVERAMNEITDRADGMISSY